MCFKNKGSVRAIYKIKLVRVHAKNLCTVSGLLCIFFCVCEIVMSILILEMLQTHSKIQVSKIVDKKITGFNLEKTHSYCCALMVLGSVFILVHIVNLVMVNHKFLSRKAIKGFIFLNFIFCLTLAILCGYITYVWQWNYIVYRCKITNKLNLSKWDNEQEFNFRVGVNGCTLINNSFVCLHLVIFFLFMCFSKALYDDINEQNMINEVRLAVASLQRNVRRRRPSWFKRQPTVLPVLHPPDTISIVSITCSEPESREPSSTQTKQSEKAKKIQFGSDET